MNIFHSPPGPNKYLGEQQREMEVANLQTNISFLEEEITRLRNQVIKINTEKIPDSDMKVLEKRKADLEPLLVVLEEKAEERRLLTLKLIDLGVDPIKPIN